MYEKCIIYKDKAAYISILKNHHTPLKISSKNQMCPCCNQMRASLRPSWLDTHIVLSLLAWWEWCEPTTSHWHRHVSMPTVYRRLDHDSCWGLPTIQLRLFWFCFSYTRTTNSDKPDGRSGQVQRTPIYPILTLSQTKIRADISLSNALLTLSQLTKFWDSFLFLSALTSRDVKSCCLCSLDPR